MRIAGKKDRGLFLALLALAALLLFAGVGWGWPGSFDQHDPTRKAVRMLWDRSLAPGIQYWGAFGYQEVLLFSVLPVTVLKKLFALEPATAEALMYLMTRILWALKALGIVAMTYGMSRALFQDRRAALISMAMVTLAPGFIAWAHIPQVDIVHAFWYMAAAWLTALGWRHANPAWLWYAAVAAGLTAGVKYVGGIVAMAPMAAVFLVMPLRKAWWRSLAIGGLAVLVFFITTPLATGDPLAWLPGYTADVWANSARETFAPLAMWTMPGALWDMLGPGAAVLALVGLALLPVGGQARGALAPWMLLLLCIVPYYLLFVGQHASQYERVQAQMPALTNIQACPSACDFPSMLPPHGMTLQYCNAARSCSRLPLQ